MAENVKFRVDFEMTQLQYDRLLVRAIKLGYLRENPNAVWNEQEEKEAARFAISKLVAGTLESAVNMTDLTNVVK